MQALGELCNTLFEGDTRVGIKRVFSSRADTRAAALLESQGLWKEAQAVYRKALAEASADSTASAPGAGGVAGAAASAGAGVVAGAGAGASAGEDSDAFTAEAARKKLAAAAQVLRQPPAGGKKRKGPGADTPLTTLPGVPGVRVRVSADAPAEKRVKAPTQSWKALVRAPLDLDSVVLGAAGTGAGSASGSAPSAAPTGKAAGGRTSGKPIPKKRQREEDGEEEAAPPTAAPAPAPGAPGPRAPLGPSSAVGEGLLTLDDQLFAALRADVSAAASRSKAGEGPSGPSSTFPLGPSSLAEVEVKSWMVSWLLDW